MLKIRIATLDFLMKLPIASSLLWVCLVFGIASTSADDIEDQLPPNVIIFYTDDMGWGDLSSYGHPSIRTPRLDRLAEEGQRWTDFYVPSPVCSPSRAALLTGRQPVRSGLYGEGTAVMFPGDSRGIPQDELTLAEGLQTRGYRTGMFGKWHLGDAREFLPTRHGFNYWFGVPYSNDMMFVGRPGIDELYRLQISGRGGELAGIYTALLDSFKKPDYRNYDVPLWRSACRDGTCSDVIIEQPVVQPTFTRRLTEEVSNFIRSTEGQPFFAYVPYSMPHLPIFADEPFTGKSLAGPYGDTIEEIDWSVGSIIDLLKELNIDDNTLVIFSSDNGPWQSASTEFAGSAGPLRGSKQEVYEGGVRVPAIFWWPGRVVPQVTSGVGSIMDVFTTVMNLVGAELPEKLDGVDLSSVLFDGDESPRTELAFYRKGVLRAYRYGDYKLHLFGQAQGGEPLEAPELYNLRRDMSEREDIAATNPSIVQEILTAIAAHKAEIERKPPLFDQRFLELEPTPAGG